MFSIFSKKRQAQKSTKNLCEKKFATKSGFTMTEVSIAILFIGLLLIAIAIITTNLVAIYRKGSTLKAVNNVGRSLIDNFTSAVNSAPSIDTTSLCSSLLESDSAIDACIDDHANGYIFHAKYAPASSEYAGRQYGGIFCTGNYSYIWNTYYGFADGRLFGLTYLNEGGNIGTIAPEDLRLIRVKDSTHRVCSSVMNSNYQISDDFKDNSTVNIDIRHLASRSFVATAIDNPVADPETNYLNSNDTSLLLYELTVYPISQDWVTLRTYLSGNFILATERGDVDIMRSGDYCQGGIIKLSSSENSGNNFDLGAEYNYCAMNKFSFAARTAGV